MSRGGGGRRCIPCHRDRFATPGINGRQSVVFFDGLGNSRVCGPPGGPKAKRMRPVRFSASAYSGLKAVPQAG
jgi:hypothetical protein